MRVKISNYKLMVISSGLFFLICFFKSFWHIDSVNILLRIAMITGTLMALACSTSEYSKVKINGIEMTWILTLCVPIMSRVMTLYDGNSIRETLGYTTFYISSVLFALVCARDEKCIKAGFKVMITYLSILVFCTIFFRFIPEIYLSYITPLFDREVELRRGYLSGNMAGLTSHYSTNGMYMAIVVIYVFCNTLCINKISKKYYKPRVILLVTMIALLMTGKRAHLLFTVVAVVVVYYFYKSNKPHGRILKIVLGLALGIVIVFWLSLMYPNLFSSFSRFISIAEDGDITTGRIDLWIKATDYFKKYPVCGIGFKQFIRIEGLDVHNVFLQLLCETGVLGFLTHVIPMSLTMFSSIRHLVFLRKKHLYNNDTEKQFYMTFAVCYQMFFLMYCITGNPWYDLPTLFPYMFCVGITLYFSREMKVFKKDIRNSR